MFLPSGRTDQKSKIDYIFIILVGCFITVLQLMPGAGSLTGSRQLQCLVPTVFNNPAEMTPSPPLGEFQNLLCVSGCGVIFTNFSLPRVLTHDDHSSRLRLGPAAQTKRCHQIPFKSKITKQFLNSDLLNSYLKQY